MNDNSAPPSVAQAMPPFRPLTAAERLQRSEHWIAEMQSALRLPRNSVELRRAANGHREAAMRLANAAMVEACPRLRMVFLEMAGLNATKAQILETHAVEVQVH